MYSIENVASVPGGEAFLLINETGTALIDTGFAFSAQAMVKNIENRLGGRALDAILLTHSHYDHASGAPYCRERWPELKVYAAAYAKKVFEKPGAIKTIDEMNENAALVFRQPDYRKSSAELSVDVPLSEGDKFSVGSMEFTVIETPGHTRDCLSFFCEKESLVIASETLGYPLLPDMVVPTYLVSYAQSLESVEKIRRLGAEKMLVSHMGLVGRDFIAEYLEKSEIWMKKTRDMIVDGYKRGLDEAGLQALLKEKFYQGEILTVQPEKAFDLNAYYTVKMLVHECAEQGN